MHELAVRLARQCRRIVQVCLREEEWIDADREFYEVIRNGLEQARPPAVVSTLHGGRAGPTANGLHAP